jgi:predicted chitinase
MDTRLFFDRIRKPLFDGRISAAQVAGITATLDAFARARWPLSWAAYGLATSYHETAQRMQPIIETTNARDKRPVTVDQAIARLDRAWAAGKLGQVKRPYWRKDATGRSWLGRGLPQTTHRANYEWAERETGIPFTKDPDLMLVMEHSLTTMIIGMERGLYTGRKLATYLDKPKPDYVGARRVINGTDKAREIADHAEDFEAALRAAGYGTAVRADAPPARKAPVPAERPAPSEEPVEDPPAPVPDAGKPWWETSPIIRSITQLGAWIAAGGSALLAADWKVIAVLSIVGAGVAIYAIRWQMQARKPGGAA